ncbi:MAG: cupredoxin family copper-binding protein, partial [Anaerolineae bacterium]
APPPEPEAPVAEEPTEEPPPEALDHAELTIANFSFRPRTVTVLVGATVVWTHEDSAPHTVTSDDGIFDAGTMAEGGSFQFTFESPGTYAYHCDIHPRMTGTIEVIEAGQASVGSTAASASGGDYYSD